MNTLTNKAAEKLLMLPKKIIVDDEPQNRYMLKSGNRLSERFILRSIDGNHLFLLEISVKSIFVCKIPLGTQNLMQMPYFAAG